MPKQKKTNEKSKLRKPIKTAAVPRGLKRKMKLAGLMAAIASKKSDQYIAETLGELRGLPQKIGQILSLKETPQAGDGVWTNLAESSDVGMDFSSVQEILRKEWSHLGREQVQRILETTSVEPIAVASLSQVHRGVFDRQDVAIKIQFPNLLESVEEDLQALGWIDVPTARMKAFKLDGYREQLLVTLKQELDFEAEAHNIDLFREQYRDFDSLEIPRVVSKLCTPRVLVTEFRQGLSVAECKAEWQSLGESLRHSYCDEAVVLIARFFLSGLLLKSVFHADPHPGNFRFYLRDVGGSTQAKDAGRVGLLAYDFGCVKGMPPKERLALASLLRGLLREDVGHDYLGDLSALGFEAVQLEPLRPQLYEALKILLEPLLSVEPFDYEKWNRSARLDQLLKENKWALRTSGPASFIFVVRVFQGLLYYLKNFEVKIALRPVLVEVLKHMAEPNVNLKVEVSPNVDFLKNENAKSALAKNFVVEVFTKGETTAKITMPARSAEEFSSLISDDILAVIHEKKIDLVEIQERVNASPLVPQVIFEMSFADGKRIKLSLV